MPKSFYDYKTSKCFLLVHSTEKCCNHNCVDCGLNNRKLNRNYNSRSPHFYACTSLITYVPDFLSLQN